MAPQLEGVQFAVPCYLACALWRMSARGGRLGSSLASYQGGSSSTRSGRYRWAAVCGSRAAMICGQRQASKQRGGSAEASIIMVATCQTCPRGTPPPPPPTPPHPPPPPRHTHTHTHKHTSRAPPTSMHSRALHLRAPTCSSSSTSTPRPTPAQRHATPASALASRHQLQKP